MNVLEYFVHISTLCVFIYGVFCFYVCTYNLRWLYNSRKEKNKKNISEGNRLDELEEFVGFFPSITIQLVISKEDSSQECERVIFEKLIEALASIAYPLHKIEIQFLEEIGASDEEVSSAFSLFSSHCSTKSFSHVTSIPWVNDDARDEIIREGIKNSSGEYILVLEWGFIPKEKFFLDTLKKFHSNERLGIIQPLCNYLNADDSFLTRFQHILHNYESLTFDMESINPPSYVTNGFIGLYRRSCIEDCLNTLDNLNFSGIDLVQTARSNKWNVYCGEYAKLDYNFSNSMQKYKNQQYQQCKDSTKCFRKFVFSIFQDDITILQKMKQLADISRTLIFIPLFILLTFPLLEVFMSSKVAYMKYDYFILAFSSIAMFVKLIVAQLFLTNESWFSTVKNLLCLPFGILFAIGMVVNSFQGVIAGLLALPSYVKNHPLLNHRIIQIQSQKSIHIIGRMLRSKMEFTLFITFFFLLYYDDLGFISGLLSDLLPIKSLTPSSAEWIFLVMYFTHIFTACFGLLFVIYWSLDSHIPTQFTMDNHRTQKNMARFLFSLMAGSLALVFVDIIVSL